MADEILADPTDMDAILLGTDSVPISRPIMFGDIFQDVSCSRGGDAEGLVMIMSHPCSMRRGAKLKERILTARVSPFDQNLSSRRWRTGYYDLFPVRGPGGPSEQYVVELSELHSADSGCLQLEKRNTSLSDHGVAVLLQRWIYQTSRDPVPHEDLLELIAPVMAEIEMQESWCDAALEAAEDRSDDNGVVVNASDSFQSYIGRPGEGGVRDQIQDASRRASARRQIRVEISRRFGA